MGRRGVLFDLYGTLVRPFRKREHTDILQRCAQLLRVDAAICHDAWVASMPDRVRGGFGSVAENFAWIAVRAGRRLTDDAPRSAQELYLTFTREGLRPVPGAVELLGRLATRGIRVGVVSNCAPDVPLVWPSSPLAPYVGYCAFSCRLGVAKPDPVIYRMALDALDLAAAATLFVGDGSDEELSGAAACGIRPVLVRTELTNTYDAVRADVDGWTGDAVDRLSEIERFL